MQMQKKHSLSTFKSMTIRQQYNANPKDMMANQKPGKMQ